MSRFLDEIEACLPSLRRYARALTRDADLADDLVQDCLERAIRKSGLWRPRGPLRAWLFKILVNIHRNDLRRRRRRPAHMPLEGLGAQLHSAPQQYGRLALAETARALEYLPDDQHEALLLVALEGLSYHEAAGVLGIPVGTLMSRLGRARARLKELTDRDDEPRLRTVK